MYWCKHSMGQVHNVCLVCKEIYIKMYNWRTQKRKWIALRFYDVYLRFILVHKMVGDQTSDNHCILMFWVMFQNHVSPAVQPVNNVITSTCSISALIHTLGHRCPEVVRSKPLSSDVNRFSAFTKKALRRWIQKQRRMPDKCVHGVWIPTIDWLLSAK